MKKIFFAACAVAAMASCAKNEPEIQRLQSDSNITFSPLVSTVTKADPTEITETTFPETKSFSVYAWYSANGEFAGTQADKTYMDNVAVKYNSNIDDGTTDGKGAWAPVDAYFWPKQGSLTFDAYYPAEVNATSDVAKGIQIANFTAETKNAKQVDILYSDRVYNKKTSTDGTNKTYDGVDIPFKHALSVVHVNVKAADAESAANIRVKSITLKNIKNQGSFDQNITANVTTTATYAAEPKWTITPNAKNVNYSATTDAVINFDGSTKVTETATKYGNSMIVMPQLLPVSDTQTDLTKTTDPVIEVVYYIGATQETAIEQTHIFKLGNAVDSQSQDPNNPTKISTWEMSKRYIYNITFGLDKIYFAPSVTDWTDVNATYPNIK